MLRPKLREANPANVRNHVTLQDVPVVISGVFLQVPEHLIAPPTEVIGRRSSLISDWHASGKLLLNLPHLVQDLCTSPAVDALAYSVAVRPPDFDATFASAVFAFSNGPFAGT